MHFPEFSRSGGVRKRSRSSVAIGALALVACLCLGSCDSTDAPLEPPARDGTPFEESFRDSSILMEHNDIAGMRTTLSRTPLPATRDHHEALLELLRSYEQVDVERLLLLTEAVSLPGAMVIVSGDRETHRAVEMGGGKTQRVAFDMLRGKGEFAPYVDAILLEGAGRVRELGPYDAGRLFARTQTDTALGALADTILPRVDDGTPDTLRLMLLGFGGSTARIPFVLEVLGPGGSLVGERESIAMQALEFDDERVALVAHLLEIEPPTTAERLLTLFGYPSFDEGKLAVLEKALVANPALRIESSDADSILRRLALDEARLRTIDLFAKALTALPEKDRRSLLPSFRDESLRAEAARRLQLP